MTSDRSRDFLLYVSNPHSKMVSMAKRVRLAFFMTYLLLYK